MLTCMLPGYPLEFNSKEEEMFQKTLSLLKRVHFFYHCVYFRKKDGDKNVILSASQH